MNYIGGKWSENTNAGYTDIINPATGRLIRRVANGTAEDVDRAASAAREAFNGALAKMPAEERAGKIHAVAKLIRKNRDELAELETLNNGKILEESIFDINESADYLDYFANLALKPRKKETPFPDRVKAETIYQPVGVCGLIVPWNYPLLMAIWKLAPALAAGNAVILKPSSITPLTSIKLFEYLDEVSYPAGAANLINGPGAVTGRAIAEHPDIDLVAFTGGTDTGREILRYAAANIKKTTLELGGKSPLLIFSDAEKAAAIDYALDAIFMTQGEVCSAGSRLYIEQDIYEDFLDDLVSRAKKIKVGNGLNEESRMGPLITEAHMNKVLSYIQSGIGEGAELLCGGARLKGPEYDGGFFVPPTIFSKVTPEMKIVREEIFGPVLVVSSFKTEDEALTLANDSHLGLAGGVFTSDPEKAQRVAEKLQAGTVWVNCFNNTYKESQWGGVKQSGIGRELGEEGLLEYMEAKQILINENVEPTGWFGCS